MSRNTPEQNRRSITKFRLEKERSGAKRLLLIMPEATSRWLDTVRQPTGATRQELITALLQDYLQRRTGGAPRSAAPDPAPAEVGG